MYDLCVPEKKILGCVNRRRWLTTICGGLPFPQAGLTAETAWKVLSLIQRDWGDSYAPRNCSVLITVGATLNEYRADSWPVGYDSEFDVRSQNSFYKRTSEKKDRQKELLEEYLEKRAQAKTQQQELLDEKVAKAEQERSRLAKAWAGERQMAAASNAYDANVMTETAAGGDTLLG